MGSCLRFNLIPLNWERADFALTIIELMRQEIIVHNNQIKSIPVSEDASIYWRDAALDYVLGYIGYQGFLASPANAKQRGLVP